MTVAGGRNRISWARTATDARHVVLNTLEPVASHEPLRTGRVASHVGGRTMKGDARIAILTQFAPSQHAGGVEVFNDSLHRALGGVEIFADSGPEDPVGGLSRVVGLKQPSQTLRAA